MRSFFDNWQEIFVGACLQFPLVFIIGWWVIPVLGVCGLLWRLGGWEHGNKAFRRLGVPLVVCGATFLVFRGWLIFGAVPFMIWVNPFSYGENSWLWKWLKNDFLVRITGYIWYWLVFSAFLCVSLVWM